MFVSIRVHVQCVPRLNTSVLAMVANQKQLGFVHSSSCWGAHVMDKGAGHMDNSDAHGLEKLLGLTMLVA